MGKIVVSNLGKAYKQYPTRWSRLHEWFTPGKRKYHSVKWVLKDINFTIQPGEAVGIIGINGAGKSTLLKMITGTTQSTTGSVQINGRVAALLELGMGFHPDFTGRQNAYMAGQLLGYKPDEISVLMPEIEAFAQIGEYIDQPVRVYSSGMQVRLAFAVATAVRPDVLIVDEALAVGDVFFQQKCFDRIRDFKKKGTTLLFVSHDMSTVISICDRAIFINNGRLEFDASPKDVIGLYNARMAVIGNNPSGAGWATSLAVPSGTNANNGDVGSYENKGVSVSSVRLLSNDQDITAILADKWFVIKVSVNFFEDYADPRVGFQIRNRRGEPIYMTTTAGLGCDIGIVNKGNIVEVNFSMPAIFAVGIYTVTVGVSDGGFSSGSFERSLVRQQDVVSLEVVKDLDADTWAGVTNLMPKCSIERKCAKPKGKILVTTSRSFLCVDFATGENKVIHSGDGLYYGIAKSSEYIYLAARRRMVSSDMPAEKECGVVHVFDHDLRLVETLVPPFRLRDMHGMAYEGGVLWITCSYDNMVARWDGKEWSKWYPFGEPISEPRDVNHFNTIWFDKDLLWLVAHNRGSSELLGFSKESLGLRSRVAVGCQAHDVWREGGDLFTCSSGEGCIVSENGFTFYTGKFPRGHLKIEGFRLVGLSEISEREQRDFTACTICCYDEFWHLCSEVRLEGEGLVLAIESFD